MTPATILIVDDDLRFTRVVKRQLQRAGHEAISLSSGIEALEWLEENRADLLLLPPRPFLRRGPADVNRRPPLRSSSVAWSRSSGKGARHTLLWQR